jgi:hypothetical protein
MKKMDAKHRVNSERRAPAFGARDWGMLGNQRNQLDPRHHQIHLVEELALACPLGLAFESGIAEAHLLHVRTVSHLVADPEVLQTFPSFEK